MKNKLIKVGILAAFAVGLTLTTGCQKDDMRIFRHGPTTEPAPVQERPIAPISNMTGRLEILMRNVGGNAGFGAIDLTINGVAVHYLDERIGKGGWVYLPSKPHLVDILQYQDGPGVLLGATSSLPMGIIDDIRVMFGSPDYVVWGDTQGRYKNELFFASKTDAIPDVALHLKVDLHRKMVVTLAFNAYQSIDRELATHYNLMPSISLGRIHYVEDSPYPN